MAQDSKNPFGNQNPNQPQKPASGEHVPPKPTKADIAHQHHEQTKSEITSKIEPSPEEKPIANPRGLFEQKSAQTPGKEQSSTQKPKEQQTEPAPKIVEKVSSESHRSRTTPKLDFSGKKEFPKPQEKTSEQRASSEEKTTQRGGNPFEKREDTNISGSNTEEVASKKEKPGSSPKKQDKIATQEFPNPQDAKNKPSQGGDDKSKSKNPFVRVNPEQEKNAAPEKEITPIPEEPDKTPLKSEETIQTVDKTPEKTETKEKNTQIPENDIEKTAVSQHKKTEKKQTDSLQETPQERVADSEPIDEDEAFLIEEEPDFFWMLQRIVWGAVKSLILLGVLGAIVWLVWFRGQDKSSTPTVKPTPPKAEETIVPVPEKTPSKETSSSAVPPRSESWDSAQWNIWVEDMRLYDAQNDRTEGITWLQKARAFFDVPIQTLISGDSVQERGEKIDHTLETIAVLLQDSYLIRQSLATERANLILQCEQKQTQIAELQSRIQNAVTAEQLQGVDTSIEAQATLQSAYTSLAYRRDILTSILQKMEPFDRSLRQLYEMITANQDALIQGIQVVDFQGDPFEVILTPEEWRELQGLE